MKAAYWMVFHMGMEPGLILNEVNTLVSIGMGKSVAKGPGRMSMETFILGNGKMMNSTVGEHLLSIAKGMYTSVAGGMD